MGVMDAMCQAVGGRRNALHCCLQDFMGQGGQYGEDICNTLNNKEKDMLNTKKFISED